jgi:hypothetical protein
MLDGGYLVNFPLSLQKARAPSATSANELIIAWYQPGKCRAIATEIRLMNRC